jgi:hypothetical protein
MEERVIPNEIVSDSRIDLDRMAQFLALAVKVFSRFAATYLQAVSNTGGQVGEQSEDFVWV